MRELFKEEKDPAMGPVGMVLGRAPLTPLENLRFGDLGSIVIGCFWVFLEVLQLILSFSTSCVGFGFTSRTRGNRELLMKHPWFILDWWFQTALARRRGCYRSCHQPNKKRPSLPGTQGWWDQLVLVRNKCMVQQRSNNTHTYVYIYM